MGVLRKKKTKGRPAAPPPLPNDGKQLTGSKMSLTPSLESASLDMEDEEEERDRVNLLRVVLSFLFLLWPKFSEDVVLSSRSCRLRDSQPLPCTVSRKTTHADVRKKDEVPRGQRRNHAT